MKTIRLKRPKENFNSFCNYEIYVGKQKVADLKAGEEKTINIQPHQLTDAICAKMIGGRSKSLSISAISENELVTVKGNKFLNRSIPLTMGFLTITSTAIFSQYGETPKNIGIGLLIIMIMGLIGAFTLWRDQWIDIDKMPQPKEALESTIRS